jgi:hypothetical protein
VKSLEGNEKFGKPWYVKEKVGMSAKVLKKIKYENHFLINLIYTEKYKLVFSTCT